MTPDTDFLKAAGIKPQPRDRWHWLWHRWSEWTEPYEVVMTGVGYLVKGQTWNEHQQDRWCPVGYESAARCAGVRDVRMGPTPGDAIVARLLEAVKAEPFDEHALLCAMVAAANAVVGAAVAEEREACAQVADTFAQEAAMPAVVMTPRQLQQERAHRVISADTAGDIAAAIRARTGEAPPSGPDSAQRPELGASE